jgi:uncharacterized tellurite resistance protein B-like protein
MLKIIKDLFSDKKAGSSKEEKQKRLQLAATVLMLEVCKADDKIDKVEVIQLNKILSSEFNLDASTIGIILSDSETQSADATSLHKFTKDINDNCDNAERIQILSYLWKISLADNHVDVHERHFIRKIARLLYLTDQDIINAKGLSQKLK